MSIHQEAVQYRAKVQEMLGKKFNIIAGDMERVRADGTIDAALKVGQLASDFTLPDAFGNPVSLSALLAPPAQPSEACSAAIACGPATRDGANCPRACFRAGST